MAPITQGLEVEKFCVLCLNWKGRLIKRAEMSSGIANSCLFQPREVFRPAIQEGASVSSAFTTIRAEFRCRARRT